jgi:hypothetical protein
MIGVRYWDPIGSGIRQDSVAVPFHGFRQDSYRVLSDLINSCRIQSDPNVGLVGLGRAASTILLETREPRDHDFWSRPRRSHDAPSRGHQRLGHALEHFSNSVTVTVTRTFQS